MVVLFVEPVLFSCRFNGLGPRAVFDFATQYVGTNDQTIVWSLNAKFEPDRDTADKSAKLCIQFPLHMSIKSGMGAQEKNFLLPYKMGILFIIVLLCLVTTLFS